METYKKTEKFIPKGGQGIPTDNGHSELRKELLRLFKNRPMGDEELLTNFGLYTRSSVLATMLFRVEVYRRIVNIPGNIFVFGLWWGQDAILFENIRAIFEPYNLNRKIVGFDTFTGYPEADIGENDKPSDVISPGVYGTSEKYEEYLAELAFYHAHENSLYHPNTTEFIKGDVKDTVPGYFESHPENITALAYFDMALYEPTKVCLEYILKTCVKGSIIVFDELNRCEFPGETQALKELIELRHARIEKSSVLPDRTFLIIE